MINKKFYCQFCGKEIVGLHRTHKKYCDNQCQADSRYKEFIRRWLIGEISGESSGGRTSRHIRRYLMENHNDICSKCGWSEKNPVTGSVPLTVNHMDGNVKNNVLDNLELICPNCHSLTPNYGNLNKGKGRESLGIKRR